MQIIGVLLTNKVHLLVDSRELATFVRAYVENNIEPVDPRGIDPNSLALDLKRNLDHAFNTQFSVEPLDATTGDPIDDLSVAAALEISTPLDLPSLSLH